MKLPAARQEAPPPPPRAPAITSNHTCIAPLDQRSSWQHGCYSASAQSWSSWAMQVWLKVMAGERGGGSLMTGPKGLLQSSRAASC
jgi:hypothetical protein